MRGLRGLSLVTGISPPRRWAGDVCFTVKDQRVLLIDHYSTTRLLNGFHFKSVVDESMYMSFCLLLCVTEKEMFNTTEVGKLMSCC